MTRRLPGRPRVWTGAKLMAIRHDYLNSSLKLEAIAERHGIHRTMINVLARRYGWKGRQRSKWAQKYPLLAYIERHGGRIGG